jgi:hypothetical protein
MAGAGRQDFDVIILRQMFAHQLTMQFGAAADIQAVPLDHESNPLCFPLLHRPCRVRRGGVHSGGFGYSATRPPDRKPLGVSHKRCAIVYQMVQRIHADGALEAPIAKRQADPVRYHEPCRDAGTRGLGEETHGRSPAVRGHDRRRR